MNNGGQVNNFQFSNFKIFKLTFFLIVICFLIGAWFLYSELYTAEAQKNAPKVKFEVKNGETVSQLADRLEKEQVIRNVWFFKRYLALAGIDKKVNIGEFEVQAPVTLARVAQALSQPGLNEDVITIIPGWTIRDIAQYFSTKDGPASGGENGMFQAEELTELIGLPAVNYKFSNLPAPAVKVDLKILRDKPKYVSYEGYLAPETYRIYKNAKLPEIVLKMLKERDDQITDQMWQDISKQGRTFHEVLTMASILEKEVKSIDDKKKVADIFWRRNAKNWALQADSTVHYALNKTNEVFTTKEERNSNSSWNTYKYPGLPPGSISNPSLESIQAALYPEKNDYWYFLTTPDGEVKYAKTLEEHNRNRMLFLN